MKGRPSDRTSFLGLGWSPPKSPAFPGQWESAREQESPPGQGLPPIWTPRVATLHPRPPAPRLSVQRVQPPPRLQQVQPRLISPTFDFWLPALHWPSRPAGPQLSSEPPPPTAGPWFFGKTCGKTNTKAAPEKKQSTPYHRPLFPGIFMGRNPRKTRRRGARGREPSSVFSVRYRSAEAESCIRMAATARGVLSRPA
jgi:hypothetical protein